MNFYKRIFLVLILFIFFSCQIKISTLNDNKRLIAKTKEKDLLYIHITPETEINKHESKPVELCIYQIKQCDSFKLTEENRNEMLTCSPLHECTIDNFKVITEPNKNKSFHFVKEKKMNSNSIVVTANYPNYEKNIDIFQKVEIPKLSYSSYFFSYMAGPYIINVNLGDKRIKSVSIQKPNIYKYDPILRIHGSKIIGTKLIPCLVKNFLSKNIGASAIKIESCDDPSKIYYVGTFSNGKVAVEIVNATSSDGFDSLYNGQCDIANSSRPISDNEAQKFLFLGDMKSSRSEHVIAKDGLAVIVHEENPISKLTITDLKKILIEAKIAKNSDKKLDNWSYFNKHYDHRINIYIRSKKSATYDYMKNKILCNQEKCDVFSEYAEMYNSDEEIAQKVFSDRGGIGLVSLANVEHNKKLMLSYSKNQNTIKPTHKTITSGDYFLSRSLYFYSIREPRNSYVRKFIDYTLSDQGQRIINEEKFIDLKIYLETAPISLDLHENEKIFYAKRLSQKLYYNKNYEFNRHYSHQLKRIVAFLSKTENTARYVSILGIVGGETKNLQINSEIMTKKVAKALKNEGIVVKKVKTYGAKLSKKIYPGSYINSSRVEIWVSNNNL